jgi:hypothetical protein
MESFQAFTDTSLNINAPVRVLAMDIDGDGKAELFVAQGPDGRSKYQIRCLRPLTVVQVDSFFATNPSFNGGGLFLG